MDESPLRSLDDRPTLRPGLPDLVHIVDAFKYILEQNIPDKQLSNAVFLGDTERRLREYNEDAPKEAREKRRNRTKEENQTTSPKQGDTKRCKTKKKTRKKTRKKFNKKLFQFFIKLI